MVAAGQCELGLVDASVATGDLRGIDLPAQEMHIVLPADHPHPAGDTITARELGALDLIVTPSGTETRAAVDDVCTALGVAPRIVVETAHRAMIVPLVLSGVGAALRPASMAQDAALRGARMLSHRPRLLRQGRLVWRSGPLSGPAIAAVVHGDARRRQ